MSFEKNKYKIVKKVISEELCDFLCSYLLIKEYATSEIYKNKIFQPNGYLGTFGDSQINNFSDENKWLDKSFSCYGDVAIETLQAKLTSVMEKHTKLKLVPTYSYFRIYQNKSELKKHIDRPSCEISSTLNLGGDPWPIYVENKKNKIKIDLNPSDFLIYRGMELPHWREPFKGYKCVQIFMHWNDINGPFKDTLKFDGRPCLGYPTKETTKKLNLKIK
jgi:hypothetical protein